MDSTRGGLIVRTRDTAPVEGTGSAAAFWDDARARATQWFRPVGDPETWRAAAYLALGLPVTFVAAVVVGLVAFGVLVTAWTVVGLLLLVPAFALVEWGAGQERRRAGMVGVVVPTRALADAPGIWARVKARATDANRWRQAAYLVTAVFVAWPLAIAGFGLWVAAAYLASLPLWGWTVGLALPTTLVLAALGVALSGLAARVVTGCGRLEAAYAAWLLGPDRFAQMQSQVETLTADRRQIIEAVAGERRRIERNLHDGVQARLVAVGIDLGMAEQMLADRPGEARALLAAAREKNRTSIAELREIGRGLHPAILGDRGLDAALSAVVAASPVPIRLTCVLATTPPPAIEEAAYFIVSEAVSNILKHAGARSAAVDIDGDARALRIVVHDDGRGGADVQRGSGLAGIDARVRALDGSLRVASPVGGPTLLAVELPMAAAGARGVAR